MLRYVTVCLLVLALALAAGAATTVVVNGKTVTVPVIEQGGKAFVDIVALMKLLGGTATFDAAAHKLVITDGTPAPAPATGSSGGGAGSVMMAGDNGEFGRVYSIGKAYPLYFSLKSAEYTTGRLTIGDQHFAPTAEQKMLVLQFTIQNPAKTETFIRWDSLKFTVVDQMNVNHEMATGWGDKESRNELALTLKPAQTVAAYCAFYVPAAGDVPKLIVQAEEGAPVLRYDLRGKVAPLTAPFADPNDPKGLSAREVVPAQMGTAYPYNWYDVTVEKLDYAPGPLGDREVDEGRQFVVATIVLKNAAPVKGFTRWDAITPTLTTADGEEGRYQAMLFANTNRDFGQDLGAGKEIRLRLLFDLPADIKASTLTIKEGESRTYEYTLAQ